MIICDRERSSIALLLRESLNHIKLDVLLLEVDQNICSSIVAILKVPQLSSEVELCKDLEV